MILEVDCGNTLIKWRLIERHTRVVNHTGSAVELMQLIEQLKQLSPKRVTFGRIVSVRSESETKGLIEALESELSVPIRLCASTAFLAGVRNGYLQPELLGADRWMAVTAAFAMMNTACLVLDVGTAVTSDFVSSEGVHLGGYICPGIRLMRDQLGQHTRRISYQPGSRTDCHVLGRRTAEAVEHGTELMLIGFIHTQINQAKEFLGNKFSIVLTGGDASLVASAIPDSIVVPDLVFRGLALAFPD